MNNKTIFFIYDATNCQPNGDPDGGGQRYNPETKRAEVSDLRIKRFGRDRLMELGKEIFYFFDKEMIKVAKKNKNSSKKNELDEDDTDKPETKISGAVVRFRHFCEKNNINIENSEKILLDNFIDVRVHGGILTGKEKNEMANITGCLQFDAVTSSINEILPGKNLIDRGITTVFISKLGKEQGSMGRDNFIRYGLFCVGGEFSATNAHINNCTNDDLELFLMSIWDGMKNKTTRSKFGHNPIACIIINHPTRMSENGQYVGRIFSKTQFSPFKIDTNKPLSDLYSINDYKFDFSPLFDVLNTKWVENVKIYCENEKFIQDYFLNLPENCELLDPFDELVKHIY